MQFSLFLQVALMSVLLKQEWPPFGGAQNVSRKGCPNRRCGDVIIEYPFGIGSNCSYDANFTISCHKNLSSSSGKPKPILTKFDLELLQAADFHNFPFGTIMVNNPIVKACADNSSSSSNNEVSRINGPNLNGSPFYISSSNNLFVSVGCEGMGLLYDENGEQILGCTSLCDQPAGEAVGQCNGYYYCCQSDFGFEMKSFSIGVRASKGSCRYAFMTASSNAFLNASVSVTAFVTHNPVAVPLKLYFQWDGDPDAYSGRNSAHSDYVEYTILPYIEVCVLPVLGALLLSSGCFWSCWFWKTKERRKETKLRAKYFKGRLKQSLSDTEVVAKTKLFTISELKKATDNFNGDRVLGQGGQGTVYKGMLTNGHVIAIKKPKSFEESQWKQFINEVILLSQVNHKHIVKLLGCCLDTKIPLLVYEFTSNGTLSQHIHNTNDEFSLKWKMRVRIASEAADAIAYLHHSSSTTIYHRDIKTTNILLDDNFRAKVSDFGISKIIPENQTHMTTCVRGTFGYLDPEYFRSSQFSEKSDVYSFGVVLVELLTGQQPIRITTTEEERSLVAYFISSMNKANLDEILDPLILQERAKKEEIMVMANVAKQCLKPRGIQRPTMKEIATQLEALRNKSSCTSFILGQTSLEIDYVATKSTLEMANAHTSPVMYITHGNCDDQERPLIFTS